MGYELDTYFIDKPHEASPRRLYSQSGADWQYRVDFERLRRERLQRTRASAVEGSSKVAAAVENIRAAEQRQINATLRLEAMSNAYHDEVCVCVCVRAHTHSQT